MGIYHHTGIIRFMVDNIFYCNFMTLLFLINTRRILIAKIYAIWKINKKLLYSKYSTIILIHGLGLF